MDGKWRSPGTWVVLSWGPAFVLLMALPAMAQDEPPPVRKKSSSRSSGGNYRAPTHIAGGAGIRPFLGATADLDVDFRTLLGGSKFVFGADYIMGGPYGWVFVPGLHLATGDRAFVVQPVFDFQYRFRLGVPLVPWVGGGASLKLGFGRRQEANIGITFRFLGGLEFFFTETVGAGLQLVLPDIGPRLTPSVAGVGTLEVTIGPHFRF